MFCRVEPVGYGSPAKSCHHSQPFFSSLKIVKLLANNIGWLESNISVPVLHCQKFQAPIEPCNLDTCIYLHQVSDRVQQDHHPQDV